MCDIMDLSSITSTCRNTKRNDHTQFCPQILPWELSKKWLQLQNREDKKGNVWPQKEHHRTPLPGRNQLEVWPQLFVMPLFTGLQITPNMTGLMFNRCWQDSNPSPNPNPYPKESSTEAEIVLKEALDRLSLTVHAHRPYVVISCCTMTSHGWVWKKRMKSDDIDSKSLTL